MDGYAKIHGLDFNAPQIPPPVISPLSEIEVTEECMDLYFDDTPNINEPEVPPDVPALPLKGINGDDTPDGTISLLDSKDILDNDSITVVSSSITLSSTTTTTTGSSSQTVDSTDCAIPSQYAHPKRSLKKLQKSKKDKEREIGNLLKMWTNLGVDDKFDNLVEKYTELHEEGRKIHMKLYLTEKSVAVLTKEKLQWQTEQNKLVMQRTRLEGVCRELQKQNKQIKEESGLRIREEEERRKEVSTKFQSTLNEVSAIMAQNTEKNTKLRDDNIDITNKFKTLCEQFEKREDQMMRMAKQMELEKQLSEAHINKAEYELKAERELWAKEREIAQQNIKSAEERIESLHAHIAGLEAHLRIYTDKYAEFESTISKSNQVFDNYKTEMGKLSKQMSKVDKESQAWKTRWERNAQAILELTETNQLQDLRLRKSDKRMEQMQNLCRQLQIERTAYLTLLRANNIEPKIPNVAIEDICPQAMKSRKEMELDILQEEMACLKKKLKDEEAQQQVKDKTPEENLAESGTSSPELKSEAKETSGTGKRRRRRGGKKNGTDSKDLSTTTTTTTTTVKTEVDTSTNDRTVSDGTDSCAIVPVSEEGIKIVFASEDIDEKNTVLDSSADVLQYDP